jgi:hypothetical protein
MPDIAPALLSVKDCQGALARAETSWNRSQLEDALRSAQHFLDAAWNRAKLGDLGPSHRPGANRHCADCPHHPRRDRLQHCEHHE